MGYSEDFPNLLVHFILPWLQQPVIKGIRSSFEFPVLSEDTKKVSKSMCTTALSIFLSLLYVTKLLQMITNLVVFVVTNHNKIAMSLFSDNIRNLRCNMKFRRKSWRNKHFSAKQWTQQNKWSIGNNQNFRWPISVTKYRRKLASNKIVWAEQVTEKPSFQQEVLLVQTE